MSAPQAAWPAPAPDKHIATRIKQLENALCRPMPYGDRLAARQEYLALRDLEDASV